VPDDKDLIIAETIYGNNNICTVIRKGNIVGCQFHPERSGEVGLKIYSNFVHNFEQKYNY
jgi:glutamine amidotransferase